MIRSIVGRYSSQGSFDTDSGAGFESRPEHPDAGVSPSGGDLAARLVQVIAGSSASPSPRQSTSVRIALSVVVMECGSFEAWNCV
jgi:hypothetical protein